MIYCVVTYSIVIAFLAFILFCVLLGNGLIDFEEFTSMIETRVERKPEEAELREMFDKDSNGFIDGNELRSTMKEVGIDLSAADVREMMREAGVEEHGRIYYEGQ